MKDAVEIRYRDTPIIEPGIPIEPRKDIALLWVDVDGCSEILRAIGSESDLYVPVAICGSTNVERLRFRERVNWAIPRAIVLGVLLDGGDGRQIFQQDGIPSDAQFRGLVEWSAGIERIAPARHALEACLYARTAHGAEIAVKVFRRADELFPDDEIILTRRIGTLWTYAELWRDIWKGEYPNILERVVTLFTERYAKGTIPPDPERGYAIYSGLASLRVLGKGDEAVTLRFGRLAEAGLDGKEQALADLALGDDPRKPYGKDGPTLAELTGVLRNPSGQYFQTLVLPGPLPWPARYAEESATGVPAPQRILN